MTRDDFNAELQTTANQLGAKLRGDQGDAMWERFGKLSLRIWANSCTLARMGDRWPNIDAWLRIVKRAEEDALGARADRQVVIRRCDCGRGTFERRHATTIFLGRGRFTFTALDPSGGADRMIHPSDWADAIEHACPACGALGWLMLDDGVSERSGRKFKAGDFIAPPGMRLPPRTADEIPSTDNAYRNDPDRANAYQDARRALLNMTNRLRLGKRAVADRLVDLADDFPEKAATLTAEAAFLADEAVAYWTSSNAPEPSGDLPPTPTLRDALIRKCEHARIRLASKERLCADCGASEMAGVGWIGGTIDSLRWPWTLEGAVRWWATHRRPPGPDPTGSAWDARVEAARAKAREQLGLPPRDPGRDPQPGATDATGNLPPIDFSGAPDPMGLPAPENVSQGQIALDDPGPATRQELSATPGASADIVPGGLATPEEPDDDANPF
jgi:hypothetical protein